jgi:hypothetical protein
MVVRITMRHARRWIEDTRSTVTAAMRGWGRRWRKNVDERGKQVKSETMEGWSQRTNRSKAKKTAAHLFTRPSIVPSPSSGILVILSSFTPCASSNSSSACTIMFTNFPLVPVGSPSTVRTTAPVSKVV